MTGNAPEVIRVVGARVHNLRDVSLTLPKNKLICLTGVSGSGKSSLAFDTLYAEGQRRYIESLSSYARQFLGELPKPDVDQISGLAPAISIQQKTSGWNPRSTVGTITQIYDYLRVLYARAGEAHCPQCGRPITAQTREHMLVRLLALPEGTRLLLLSPKVRGQKGEYRDLFASLLQQGYARARVNGEVVELANPPTLDRYRRHDIEVVVDRLVIRAGVRGRLAEALDLALAAGEGTAIAAIQSDRTEGPRETTGEALAALRPARRRKRTAESASAKTAASGAADAGDILLSSGYACTHCGVSFESPDPQMLSFNSPRGMCSTCDGLGTRVDFDPRLLIPDTSLGMLDPCIVALRIAPGRWRRHILLGVARHVGFELDSPWRELSSKAKQALLYGTGDAVITCEWKTRHGIWKHGERWEGVIAELHAKYRKAQSTMVRGYYEQFMRQAECPTCHGARLTPQALAIRLAGRADADARAPSALNIAELCRLSISSAAAFVRSLELSPTQELIAREPLKEIRTRLQFLIDVGLEYLTLDRAAPTLSGGESQRIRLASQIGCGLVGVLYVLDEPSIGLHARDNQRLLASLQRLRDMGNTVIVVEHDRDTMLAADHIVDFGPGPGVRGGQVVGAGSLDEVVRAKDSLTGAYLSGRAQIETPAQRRPVRRRQPVAAADLAKSSKPVKPRGTRPSAR